MTIHAIPTHQLRPAGRGHTASHVRAAQDLLPGSLIWPNGTEPVRVLAVLPGTDNTVTIIITEPDGTLGCLHRAADDGVHTGCGLGSWTVTAHAILAIAHWHSVNAMRCCERTGPYCHASITYAYTRLHRGRATADRGNGGQS